MGSSSSYPVPPGLGIVPFKINMMLGWPGQPASQAEASARAVQGPWVSGRVRRLDAVDDRVNGHKAIYKARHL